MASDGPTARHRHRARQPSRPVQQSADTVAEPPIEQPETRSEPEIPESQEPAEPEQEASPQAPAVARKALTGTVAARLPAIRAWLVPRLPRLTVTVVAGWLLLFSFPPRNWWWGAVVAFALLAWQTWHHLPGNVQSATGARRGAILGQVTYA